MLIFYLCICNDLLATGICFLHVGGWVLVLFTFSHGKFLTVRQKVEVKDEAMFEKEVEGIWTQERVYRNGWDFCYHTQEKTIKVNVYISMLINREEDCQCFGITSLDFNIPFDNNRRKIGEWGMGIRRQHKAAKVQEN